MNNRGNRVLKLCALLFLATALFALLYLLKLRFEAGDSTPSGSSLRSDPLGVEVLFKSLNSSGIALAERNYFEIKLAVLEHCDMLVFSHASPNLRGLPTETLHDFVTNHGGRLLITLGPATHVRERNNTVIPPRDADKDDGERASEAPETEKDTFHSESNRLCCGVDSTNLLWHGFMLVEMKHKPLTAELNPEYGCSDWDLPDTLPVRTVAALSTNLLHNGWQAVYSCSGMPVVVERRCNQGSVVISSLSYPFSNEAMRAERETEFLLWSLDGCKRILFDESHFGLVVTRTVAKLIRKNNLHYALLVLLIPVILYFWQATTPLIPRYTENAAPDYSSDPDCTSALCRLLMRAVPPDGVVSVALDGWRAENCGSLRGISVEQREIFDKLVDKSHNHSGKFMSEKEIIAAYNEVVSLLQGDV